jgi:hypothetical protein
MQGHERPASDVSLFGEKHTAGLAVRGGVRQQVLHLIQWNSHVGEHYRPGRGNFVVNCGRIAQSLQIGLTGQHLQPAHGVQQRGVSNVLVSLAPHAQDCNLPVLDAGDEFLHGSYVKKLMDIVVVSQEVRRDLSRRSELSVLSDYGLDFFDKGVFGVVAGNVASLVVCVLKFLGFSELDDLRRDCNSAVRSCLIKTDL